MHFKTKAKPNPPSSSYNYTNKTLKVSPECSAPRTVRVWHNGHFTGFIPFTKYGGDNVNNVYLHGQDLILSCDITVAQLESPVHTTVPAVRSRDIESTKF